MIAVKQLLNRSYYNEWQITAVIKIKNVKKAVVMRKKLHHLLKRKRKVKKLKIKIMNWDSFWRRCFRKDCPRNVLIQQELNNYFAERPSSSDTEPLSWWKVNAAHYPTMYEWIGKATAMYTSYITSLWMYFSATGYIASKLRAALSPENIRRCFIVCMAKQVISIKTINGI